jgi:hypothetical protein
MGIKKIMKLSLIGGLSGGIESLIGFLSSLILPKHTLLFDFFLGGLFFTIVGVGIVISLIIAIPELFEKKFNILIIGVIGGFIAGLFFHFGIGLYLSIAIYSVFIGFAIKLLQVPKIALKISSGGILGGFGGSIISTIFLLGWLTLQESHPILQNQLSIISVIISTFVITYFMNFGMLVAISKVTK